MNEQVTKPIFCAKCQQDTPHTARVDQNGEFVFECVAVMDTLPDGRIVPHHFIKLPSDHPVEQWNNLFSEHKEQNLGQVSVEKQEATLNLFMNDEVTPAEPALPVTEEATETEATTEQDPLE